MGWKQMSRAFRSLDKGRTGTLSPQDFSKVLTSHMAQAEIEQLALAFTDFTSRPPRVQYHQFMRQLALVANPSVHKAPPVAPQRPQTSRRSAPSRRRPGRVQRPSTAAVASKPTTVQASAAADPSATSSAPLPVPSKSGGTIAISKECLRSTCSQWKSLRRQLAQQDKLRHGVVDVGIFCQVVEKLGTAMSTDDFKTLLRSFSAADAQGRRQQIQYNRLVRALLEISLSQK